MRETDGPGDESSVAIELISGISFYGDAGWVHTLHSN
jgi:hypothetical protein